MVPKLRTQLWHHSLTPMLPNFEYQLKTGSLKLLLPGRAGAWHPPKFWTSPLAPADFEVLNTKWHPQSWFYVISGTLSFKFLTQALLTICMYLYMWFWKKKKKTTETILISLTTWIWYEKLFHFEMKLSFFHLRIPNVSKCLSLCMSVISV